MRQMVAAALSGIAVLVALVAVVDLTDPRFAVEALAAGIEPCDCGRFAEQIAAAEKLFAKRGADVMPPLDAHVLPRFRERVDEAYARAACLTRCEAVPERERNRARVLLAVAGFKVRGLPPATAKERLTAGVAATERCLEIEPGNASCHLWRASSRGILARDTWNPWQLRLPRQLLEDFRAARGDTPPGSDIFDGAPTRGEVALLVRVPAFVGGDPQAARSLMERAQTSPRFPCMVFNRLLLAEVLARTGEPGRAADELRTAIAAGMPSCSEQRYENALALETAARCLARLVAHPTVDPGWHDDCS